ncbi:hypothetical protein [Burkholderia mayonis]|uniref:hypothetical protein n=1 Tax=Burkholderia mayonis TaxID=1385591 RepID=UPI000AD7C358|nr:hypothetical protein [Burkholderia mayonis]
MKRKTSAVFFLGCMTLIGGTARGVGVASINFRTTATTDITASLVASGLNSVGSDWYPNMTINGATCLQDGDMLKLRCGSIEVQAYTNSSDTDNAEFRFYNLSPGTSYNISLRASSWSGGGQGSGSTTFQTRYGYSQIDRAAWSGKELDASRHETNCGNVGQLNCWQWDDQVRDNLVMDSTQLDWTSTIRDGGQFPEDGRYIFVYRTIDNTLVLRKYDRAHNDENQSCLAYSKYRFKPNLNSDGSYKHVRHSQLNGGWSPVWCAGEMTVKFGQLWRLNNASGHYQPPQTCLAYVEDTLRTFQYSFAPDYVSGNYSTVSTAESNCDTVPDPLPSQDDRDEVPGMP